MNEHFPLGRRREEEGSSRGSDLGSASALIDCGFSASEPLGRTTLTDSNFKLDSEESLQKEGKKRRRGRKEPEKVQDCCCRTKPSSSSEKKTSLINFFRPDALKTILKWINTKI